MKRLNFLIIAVTLIFMISCDKDSGDIDSSTKSYVITLQPDPINGNDAFVEEYPYNDYNNRNWGESLEFAAISATAAGIPFIVRSFVDFNFDIIPDNAIIDSAKLSLYAYGNNSHGMGHDTLSGTNECYLQRVIGNWYEDSITWNSQPQTTELNQIIISQSDSTMQDYIGINITNLVRDVYNNREESYGFMLRLKNEDGYRRMFFATSDVVEENKRPKLDIYYSLSNK